LDAVKSTILRTQHKHISDAKPNVAYLLLHSCDRRQSTHARSNSCLGDRSFAAAAPRLHQSASIYTDICDKFDGHSRHISLYICITAAPCDYCFFSVSHINIQLYLESHRLHIEKNTRIMTSLIGSSQVRSGHGSGHIMMSSIDLPFVYLRLHPTDQQNCKLSRVYTRYIATGYKF